MNSLAARLLYFYTTNRPEAGLASNPYILALLGLETRSERVEFAIGQIVSLLAVGLLGT